VVDRRRWIAMAIAVSLLVLVSGAPLFDDVFSRKVLASAPDPVGQTGTWNLVFSDEFDGTTLNLAKWRPNWLGPNDTAITKPVNSQETACYDPKQVSVQNGELDLVAVARPCLNWAFASGLVESNGKFNFTYGYMEARIWTPAGVGVWPAFWSDGQNWPQDGEIDVLEAYGTDRSTFHYHYAGCGGDCGPGGEVTVPGATTGWHIYAADWEPGVITWYYDGAKVWQYTTAITASPQYLILNLGLNSDQPAVPATMRVDYVRVWKKGVSLANASPTSEPLATNTPTPTRLPATPSATYTSTATPRPTMTASPSATATLRPTHPSVTPTNTSEKLRGNGRGKSVVWLPFGFSSR